MAPRPLVALVVGCALLTSSCSAVADLTGSEDPPEYSAAGLLLSSGDVPGDGEWADIDGDKVESELVDNPAADLGISIDPAECEDEGAITAHTRTQDLAGLSNSGSPDDTSEIVGVLTGARSAEQVREAREPCDGATMSNDRVSLKMSQDVEDGPEIEGADDSFALETTLSVPGGSEDFLAKYALVAEVRQTLVVALIATESRSGGATISDAAKAEIADVLEAQVAEIESAP